MTTRVCWPTRVETTPGRILLRNLPKHPSLPFPDQPFLTKKDLQNVIDSVYPPLRQKETVIFADR